MFKKILIANRGEIAVRIISAARELDIKTVAIYSEPDHLGRHVKLADEAYLLNGQPGKVYLDIEQIVAVAKKAACDAIHPGYGFLAENAPFAEACAQEGLVFIGPRPEVIAKMGSKVESRKIMEAAGVPVVPGTTKPVTDAATIKELGIKYGYPLAIKASAGGGGRGLRVVKSEEEIEQALAGAKREGGTYFGNDEVYVEKYLAKPHHVEVQILGDNFGKVIHLYERDCSSQRRHQKLLEESPAPHLVPELRAKILAAAVKAGEALGYNSAGTVECLATENDFYFLEVNTRIQVEHPITEAVTGVDLVKEQILVAAGQKLALKQSDVVPRGCAIECRINAEDPQKNFMPSPGIVSYYEEPRAPWVRVDSACYTGYQILPFYDSLLAKLIVWGRDRQEAVSRMRLALKDFVIVGVKTTIPFHLWLLDQEDFQKGLVDTNYVEGHFKKYLEEKDLPAYQANTSLPSAQASANIEPAASLAPKVTKLDARNFEVEVNQKTFKVAVSEIVNHNQDATSAARKTVAGRQADAHKAESNGHSGKVKAEMHGLVKEILVNIGDPITIGQRLLIFEAMKMESEIVAKRAGKILSLAVKPGDTVEASTLLMTVGD
jgi:acetyl-CoA/propionyl-CoA carboxylase biotin carboxyl carrier protein